MQNKKSEVDLRVAQELKNHQDFVYQTNQSIQSLKNSIELMSGHSNQLIHRFKSEKKEIEIAVENFQDGVKKSCYEIQQLLSTITMNVTSDISQFRKEINQISQDLVCKSDYEKLAASVVTDKEEVLQKIYSLSNQLSSEKMAMRGCFQEKIDSLKQHVDNKPSEIESFRSEMKQLLESLKTDLKGFSQELAIIKKDNRYSEKKFEIIYTLIQGLQDGR